MTEAERATTSELLLKIFINIWVERVSVVLADEFMTFLYEFPFTCKSIDAETLNRPKTGLVTFNEEYDQTLAQFTQKFSPDTLHPRVNYANWVALDQTLLCSTSFRGLTLDITRH